MNDINNLKASLQNKLKSMEGLPNPNANTSAMFSNSNKINLPDNPFSIVSKDVVISGKMPELAKDALAPSNIYDEKAKKEWFAELKLKDPNRFKIEMAKEMHLQKMKELTQGYSDAEKERNKRRSK